MQEIKFILNEKGHGGFYILEGAEQLGEMVISIAGNKLTVYHTEVSPKAEGKGFAKMLLEAMVAKEFQFRSVGKHVFLVDNCQAVCYLLLLCRQPGYHELAAG